MAINVDRPKFSGNDAEDIEVMRKWAIRTAEDINYALNHLDNTNFVSEYATKEDLKTMEANLRGLIK